MTPRYDRIWRNARLATFGARLARPRPGRGRHHRGRGRPHRLCRPCRGLFGHGAATRSTARAAGSRRASSTATPISCMAATAPMSSSCASPEPPIRRSPPPAAASSRPSRRRARRARTRSSPPARARLADLLAEGVTTVEIKSGYGLDPETELTMLRAARRLGERRPSACHELPRRPRLSARTLTRQAYVDSSATP